jgi:hypothetical protein
LGALAAAPTLAAMSDFDQPPYIPPPPDKSPPRLTREVERPRRRRGALIAALAATAFLGGLAALLLWPPSENGSAVATPQMFGSFLESAGGGGGGSGDITSISVGASSTGSCTSGDCVIAPTTAKDRWRIYAEFNHSTVFGDFANGNTGCTATIGGEANHPGTFVCTACDAATDRCGLTTQTLESLMLNGSGPSTASVVVHYTQLSVAAEEFVGHYGFGDSASAEPTDGAYIRYDRTSGGDFYQCVTSNNSTRTVLTMDGSGGTVAAPVTAGTWRRLDVVVNAAATSVGCYVDGVLSGTVATNIPTARTTGVIFQTRKTVQTAAVALSWKYDYVEAYQDFTTAR